MARSQRIAVGHATNRCWKLKSILRPNQAQPRQSEENEGDQNLSGPETKLNKKEYERKEPDSTRHLQRLHQRQGANEDRRHPIQENSRETHSRERHSRERILCDQEGCGKVRADSTMSSVCEHNERNLRTTCSQ